MRWGYFRMWQKDNRGICDDKAEFAEHIESQKRQGIRYEEDDPLSDPEDIARRLGFWQDEREYRRQAFREVHTDRGFPEYAEAVKRRLTRHGFTATFQLDEDPKRQNELTTWIEYLNYEYWWCDRYTAGVSQLQPRRDEAWKILEDSNVLRPGETEETLRGMGSILQQVSDRVSAQEALSTAKEEAELVLETIEQQRNGQLPSPLTWKERLQMIEEASSKYKAANTVLGLVKRRTDLITAFFTNSRSYEMRKEEADRQHSMVRWVLDQIPLIKVEVDKPRVSCAGPKGGRKRRLEQDGDDLAIEAQDPKRQRGGDQQSSLLAATSSSRLRFDGVLAFAAAVAAEELPSKLRKKIAYNSSPKDVTADTVDKSDVVDGKPRPKRQREDIGDSSLQSTTADRVNESDVVDGEPRPKRQRKDSSDSSPQYSVSNIIREPSVTGGVGAETKEVASKRRARVKVNSQPDNAPQPRRSARIAAQQAASQNTVPAPAPQSLRRSHRQQA